jgi:hypothetical protein
MSAFTSTLVRSLSWQTINHDFQPEKVARRIDQILCRLFVFLTLTLLTSTAVELFTSFHTDIPPRQSPAGTARGAPLWLFHILVMAFRPPIQ